MQKLISGDDWVLFQSDLTSHLEDNWTIVPGTFYATNLQLSENCALQSIFLAVIEKGQCREFRKRYHLAGPEWPTIEEERETADWRDHNETRARPAGIQ